MSRQALSLLSTLRVGIASTAGTVATLVLILWLTVGGILQLALQYDTIRSELSRMDIEKLRNGFATLNSMIILSNTIEAAARKGEIDAVDRAMMSRQIDDLIRQSRAFNASNVADPDRPHVKNVRQAFVDVLSIGDAALARRNVNLAELDVQGTDAINRAKRALVVYFDTIHGQEMATAYEQNQILHSLTLGAAGLLMVFCIIAFAAVILFRSEVAARVRGQVAERRAQFLAFYDPMTKLANRTKFSDTATEKLKADERLLILLIDLDEFKAVNDTLGHAAGDVLLATVAGRISKAVAAVGGMAARLGGDEFAAILPHLGSRERVENFLDLLLEKLVAPVTIDGNVLTPGASLGLSGLLDPPGEPVNELSNLLHHADYALYASKRAGRGRATLFDEDIWQSYNARRLVQDAMPKALDAGDFFLIFQPQVDLRDWRIFGLEALVRWRHNGEVLTPGTFLPVAEESGQILRIDAFVLKEATRLTAAWNTQIPKPVRVSVNLSALNFQNDDIVGKVAEALSLSGLYPSFLTLEMTETVLIEDWKKVNRILSDLRGLGVRISLDDFGSGYSSLGYLRKLEVQEIKIDRSFVQDIESSAETRFVLDAVADIARGLDMQILVEGLETAEQVEIVRGFGCRAGQGFHFGPLLSVDDIEAEIQDKGFLALNSKGWQANRAEAAKTAS